MEYVEAKHSEVGEEDDLRFRETSFIDSLQKLIPEVRGFQLHWAIRDSLALWRRSIDHTLGKPAAKTVYIEMDWKETPRQLVHR